MGWKIVNFLYWSPTAELVISVPSALLILLMSIFFNQLLPLSVPWSFWIGKFKICHSYTCLHTVKHTYWYFIKRQIVFLTIGYATGTAAVAGRANVISSLNKQDCLRLLSSVNVDNIWVYKLELVSASWMLTIIRFPLLQPVKSIQSVLVC